MRIFHKVLTGFAAGGLALALAACGGEQKPKMPPPPQVSAVAARAATVPITYEYPGRVAGYKETEVRARVGGILLKRNFNEGAAVKQGQLLFEIDPSVYEAEYARQVAQVAQAKANYIQSVADADRTETLWKQQFQSTAYRDQTVAKRDSNKALVSQAEAQLRQAELNLQYTKVTAPISGMTSRENVPEGSLIAADSSANLLTTITQTDPVYINFSYSGADAQAMRGIIAEMRRRNENLDNLKVRIRFGSGRDYEKLGTVDFTSPVLDKATGSLGVRAIVANPDNVLVPGQFVRLILQGLELNDVIAVPEQALMQDNNGQFVYVVTPQDEIEKRQVAVSRQLSNRSWLLERVRAAEITPEDSYAEPGQKPAHGQPVTIGLKDGERVVTEGQFRIGSALAAMPQGVKLKVAVSAAGGSASPAAAQPGK